MGRNEEKTMEIEEKLKSILPCRASRNANRAKCMIALTLSNGTKVQ